MDGAFNGNTPLKRWPLPPRLKVLLVKIDKGWANI